MTALIHSWRRAALASLSLLGLSLAANALQEDDDVWPHEIVTEQGTISLYQPQPETFEGNNLTARAAVGIIPRDQTEPVFGTVWLSATVETDRSERIVFIREMAIPRVRFPDSTLEQEAALSSILEESIEAWDVTISLDRLLTSLESAEKQKVASEDLGTEPPQIIFTEQPTVLVLIDGEPRMTLVDDSSLMRVVNTPFLIVFDGAQKLNYLYAGEDAWYTAPELTGSWKFVSSVPAEVAKLAPDPADAPDPDAEPNAASDVPPTILVSTVPAELIATQGKPQYTPLADNELMYVSNTDGTVLLEIAEQRYFVLLSGRWYASKSLKAGPWEYVAPDALPAAFEKIPEDSEIGDVRAFVGGTDEAQDAVLDAQIPQTAKVDRKTATLDVEYDGDPKFEPIASTELKYAVNTPTAVLSEGAKYYACDEGVWFVADSPGGPWAVATERPQGVESIPADCPVYNVKYVYIYHVTPTVVYVGYTPAYTGSYVYNGTVVYGTGYYYPGWYGSVYYPRPATWGFGVRWNPWTGWSFGLTYSYGPFTFGIGFGHWGRWHGGWWGPARFNGYRRGHRRGFHHGYRSGFRAGYRAGSRHSNIYHGNNRPGVNSPSRPGNRPGTGPGGGAGSGPGSGPGTGRPETKPATGNRPGESNGPSGGRTRENDLYSDKNGDVHRRNDNGSWDRVSGGGGASDRSTGASQRSSMERDHQARQRGSSRTQSYQRSRGGGRGGGGRGGGRRR